MKKKAKNRRKNVGAGLRPALAQELQPKKMSRKARATVKRIAAMTPKDVEQTDSVELLREDRDR